MTASQVKLAMTYPKAHLNTLAKVIKSTSNRLQYISVVVLISCMLSATVSPQAVIAQDTKKASTTSYFSNQTRTSPILQAPNNPDGQKKKDVKFYTVKGALFAQAQNAVEELPEYIDGTDGSDQISVYTVRSEDTIQKIADMYDVSTNTILWANDIKKGTPLTVGQVLVILPINGVKYKVVKGDTVASIAKKFQGDAEEIADFNEIDKGEALALGQEIIVPGGVIQNSPVQPVKITSKPGSGGKVSPNTDNSGYFGIPVNGILTQGMHDGIAVDIGAPTGTPIYASAGGTVLIARTGWNGGYGNYVVIKHPNGVQTLYAHMSAVIASQGETVSKGEVIGKVGSTGRSTGPHLHFEMRGMTNIFKSTPLRSKISR